MKFIVFAPCEICTIAFLVFQCLSSVSLEKLLNDVDTVYKFTVNYSIWRFNVEDIFPLKTYIAQNLNLNKRFHLNNLSVEHLIAFKISELLINIFGSKISDELNNKPSINVVKFLGVQFSQRSIDFSMTYSPFRIRFIGCGNTFANKRLYSVMLASFDMYCWISIIIVIFIFALMTWTTLTDTTLTLSFDALLAMVKNVLEQSTPYPKSFK